MTNTGHRATVLSGRNVVIAILLGGIGSLSEAQFGGASGMGGMRRGRTSDAQSARSSENSPPGTSRLEQLSTGLLDLRVRLLITPEQATAWETFYARFMELGTTVPRAQSYAEQQSALQAMQSQLSIEQNRYTLTESLSDAFKALYAVLSPEQHRTADEVFPRILSLVGPDTAGRPSNRTRSQ